MRKPRSCSFEASKRDTLILKELLHVWGARRWERTLRQDGCLRVSLQRALAWVRRVRDGWPPYFWEEMTKPKHATERNIEGNRGKLGLPVLINTKTMARGI